VKATGGKKCKMLKTEKLQLGQRILMFLFLFCIKLAEKNKILPVGHQPSSPLNMCFVFPFLSFPE
jgi:hypothetical protein